MALTGKTLDAKKAKKVGLVDAVVEPLGKLRLLQASGQSM
jgi:enoyl-CoA hydratase/carnithine racemase